MLTHCFLDANHADDTDTRQSQTGTPFFLKQFSDNLVQKKSELSWGINVWIIVPCNEECSGDNIGLALKTAHVWGYYWRSKKYILWQRGSLCEHNTAWVKNIQEASQNLLLRVRSGHGRNNQSVKGAYINQLGWPIYKYNGSTKKRWTNGQVYILRGEWEYVVFIP